MCFEYLMANIVDHLQIAKQKLHWGQYSCFINLTQTVRKLQNEHCPRGTVMTNQISTQDKWTSYNLDLNKFRVCVCHYDGKHLY